MAWTALFVASAGLTAWVSGHETPSAEADAIRVVQSWPVPGTTVSSAVRALTGTEIVLAVGAVFAVFLWWSGARREALMVAALLIALPLAQAGLKQLVDRPRSDVALARAGFSSSSFPAGHVMSPVVIYGALIYVGLATRSFGPRLRIVVISVATALIATTGIVNVYLGVHWPTDAVGGYLWGLVVLIPACRLLEMGRMRGAGN